MALPKFVRRALKPGYLVFLDARERLTRHREDVRRAQFYAQFVGRGDLVFDVGANTGNRTRPFLRLGAKVIAFEPQTDLAGALKKQFATNANVVVVDKAVGREKTGRLRRADASTISSMSEEWIEAVKDSGRFAGHQWADALTVPMVSLDEAIAAHGSPAFVKVDVEGYEFEVVSSLSQPVAALSMEFTPERLEPIKGCIDLLTALGSYEFQVAEGEDLSFRLPDWSDASVALLCIRQMGASGGGDLYARLR